MGILGFDHRELVQMAAKGNEGATRQVLLSIFDRLDALNKTQAATAPPTSAPSLSGFNVQGIDGHWIIDILPFNQAPADTVAQLRRLAASGVTSTSTLLYQLQSSEDANFADPTATTTYGGNEGSSQLHYDITEPGVRKYWRMRSRFPGGEWTKWQMFMDPAVCGVVSVYSGLLRSQSNALVNSAMTPIGGNPLTQDGLTKTIEVADSEWTSGDQRIKYKAGEVTPADYGLFHVYCDDPERRGGAVVYKTAQNPSDLTGADGRVWFGKITTVSGGGGTGSGGGSGACLIGDVEIEMGDGSKKPMRDIRLGDQVRSIDGGVEEVVYLEAIAARPCFRFTFGDGKILRGCSATHPLKYVEANFQQAFEIQVGDRLQVKGGSALVTEKLFIGKHTVYKMGLNRTRVYFADDVVSHNALAAEKSFVI